MANYCWYNNGIFNMRIYENENVPNGFIRGFLRLTKKKKMPPTERGQRYRERRSSQKETVILRKIELKKRLMKIEEMSKRNATFNDIYSLVKYDDKFQELNNGMSNIINEKMLISQLFLFPKFINTITASLKDLYQKEPTLQNRKSYNDYIIDIIKNSPIEYSYFFNM
jgi:putative cell wall-binding protein